MKKTGIKLLISSTIPTLLLGSAVFSYNVAIAPFVTTFALLLIIGCYWLHKKVHELSIVALLQSAATAVVLTFAWLVWKQLETIALLSLVYLLFVMALPPLSEIKNAARDKNVAKVLFNSNFAALLVTTAIFLLGFFKWNVAESVPEWIVTNTKIAGYACLVLGLCLLWQCVCALWMHEPDVDDKYVKWVIRFMFSALSCFVLGITLVLLDEIFAFSVPVAVLRVISCGIFASIGLAVLTFLGKIINWICHLRWASK